MSSKFTNQELFMIFTGLSLFTLILYIDIFYFEKIANEKAKNPDNLINGCMYYEKLNLTKQNSIYISFNIDNRYYSNTLKSIPTSFYEHVRSVGFDNFDDFQNFISSNGRDVCYQVSYIKLDYIVFKKIFIYKYHGIKNDIYFNLSINQRSSP